jgi:hypothetical protein
VAIEERFAEIGAVAGVAASFICDNGGRVIASSFGEDADVTPVRDVARELLQTAAVLHRIGEPARQMDFTYAGRRVVLCAPQVEISLLRLTLNVATAQLRDDVELRNLLRGHVANREVLESELDQISWQLMRTLEGKDANDA